MTTLIPAIPLPDNKVFEIRRIGGEPDDQQDFTRHTRGEAWNTAKKMAHNPMTHNKFTQERNRSLEKSLGQEGVSWLSGL